MAHQFNNEPGMTLPHKRLSTEENAHGEQGYHGERSMAQPLWTSVSELNTHMRYHPQDVDVPVRPAATKIMVLGV